jgi:hypothetical protein
VVPPSACIDSGDFMNAVIHLFAGLGGVVLAVLWIRTRHQLNFARTLLLSQKTNEDQQRVLVSTPLDFFKRLSSVLGITLELDAAGSGRHGRMNPRVWTEIFLQHGITLIRCLKVNGSNDLVVEVELKQGADDAALVARLQAATGGLVAIRLRPSDSNK